MSTRDGSWLAAGIAFVLVGKLDFEQGMPTPTGQAGCKFEAGTREGVQIRGGSQSKCRISNGGWRLVGWVAVVVALLSFSPALRAQNAGQKAQAASSSKYDPHDLSGVWMRENGPLNCSVVGVANCSMCDTTHTCVTGTKGVPPGGYNILPEQVHMTKWANDRWMSQDGGKGESGNDDPYDHCDPLKCPS